MFLNVCKFFQQTDQRQHQFLGDGGGGGAGCGGGGGERWKYSDFFGQECPM